MEQMQQCRDLLINLIDSLRHCEPKHLDQLLTLIRRPDAPGLEEISETIDGILLELRRGTDADRLASTELQEIRARVQQLDGERDRRVEL